MSQFEYISIAVSLVLTFGIARLLSGLPVFFSGVRPYWIHSLWCIQAVINYAMFWWLFWNFRDVTSWTLGSFLLALLYPALCYVGAAVLIPADASRDTDWRKYFYSVRRFMFAIFLLNTGMLPFVSSTISGEPLLPRGLIVAACFVVLYAAGMISASERVHRAIVLVNLVAIVIGYAPLIYTPFGT